MTAAVRFPNGARFAFTILDDTDDATLENVRPVYERLREYGFRTTKTAWPFVSPEPSRLFFAADTLERPDYLAFVHELVEAGFELASHGASMESSPREVTLRAFEFYEREFGFAPRLHANHGFNRENLYWGRGRFQSPLIRSLLALRGAAAGFEGERPRSPHYWGDVARERIQYVRNFTFRGLNLLRADPWTPYRLDATPEVGAWFSTSDAPDVEAFAKRVTRPALERLEDEGGVCIVSTHLGKGFVRDGRLDERVDAVLRWLAGRPGHFVPVSELLDGLAEQRGRPTLGTGSLLTLESRYLLDRLAERLLD